MTQRILFRTLMAAAILLVVPTPALSMIGSVDCEGSESVNIRLGLPMDLANPEAYGGELVSAFREYGRCGDTAEVSLEIAYGSDYEILHWLTLGLVDAAVVGEVSRFLLHQDDISLVELPAEERKESTVLGGLEFWDQGGGKEAIEWQSPALQSTLLFHWCTAVSRRVEDAVLQESLQAGGCDDLPQKPNLLVFPSHLSTAGFAEPLGRIQEWLEPRIKRAQDHCASCGPSARRNLLEAFWKEVISHSRFTLGRTMASMLPSWSRAAIRFTSREVYPRTGEAPGRIGSKGPRLVVGQEWAERFMGPITFPPFETDLPHGFTDLLKERAQALRFYWPMEDQPGQVFRVRTFEFTLEESIRLIRSHQESSQQSDLALVLPGGGVKAAYQTPVVDRLYTKHYLINSEAENLPETANAGDSLDVDVVIGTSGGALLGYFVARLNGSRSLKSVTRRDGGRHWEVVDRRDGSKSWELVDLLWKKPHGNGQVVLESLDVFGMADMLRFFSLIAIFLIFCGWLFVFSFDRRTPFFSEPLTQPQGRRPRLLMTVLPLMILTPFLVRYVNGARAFEHIPVVEGLFYTVFVWILLFADQCLGISEADSRPRPRSRGGLILLALGLAAVVLPLVAKMRSESENHIWLDGPVSFWAAYLAFGAVIMGGGLVLPIRLGGSRENQPGLRFRSLMEVGVAALVALGGVYLLLTTESFEGKVTDPFFSLLLLALLLFGANYFSVRSFKWRVIQWLAPYARARDYVQLLLAAFLTAAFCRSTPGPDTSLMAVLRADSILQIKWGSFLICFGVLSLFLASLHWMHYDSKGRYSFSRIASFLGSLFVIVGHLVVVYLVLIFGAVIFPDKISLLELTAEFWTGLVVVSGFIGLLMMLWGAWRGWPKSLGTLLNYSLNFLASHHHVRGLVTRRFLRIFLMATASALWWNLVVAPAFYGNQAARTYLQEADGRFRSALSEIPEDPPELPLTTMFLTPTNDLGKSRSSVFAFFPGEGECPVFRSRPGSAAEWLVYRVVPGAFEPNPRDPCLTLSFNNEDDREMVQSVVFASGSPFPIFPAHRVEVSRGSEPSQGDFRSLVDGGYSNNVPVDLALSAEAAQVLIVHSSPNSELQKVSSSEEPKRSLPGPLARNLNRLPGYLFQRSQQVDLLSREALFVLSLSPSKEAQAQLKWPSLVDFRAETIKTLERLAKEDLEHSRRIGWVESWGKPRFRNESEGHFSEDP